MIQNLYKWEEFFKFVGWNYEYVQRDPSDEISCDIIIHNKNGKNLALYAREYPQMLQGSFVDERENNVIKQKIFDIIRKYPKDKWFVVPMLYDFDNLPDNFVNQDYPLKPFINEPTVEKPKAGIILNPIDNSSWVNLADQNARNSRMQLGDDLISATPIGLVELTTRSNDGRFVNFDTGVLLLCEFEHKLFDVSVWSNSEYRMVNECVLTGKHISDKDFMRYHTISSMQILFELNHETTGNINEINDIIIL